MHCAALRALGEHPGVSVAVLVDGEEEIGSPTLPALLAEHRERLDADVLVLADSTNWRVGVPALTTSLRGGVTVVVEVRTLRHALHNGVYGGPTPDALTALARLLATCHTDAGDVAVAGLGRGTADPLDLTEAQFRADAGVLDGVALLGSGSLTSRLWRAPALSVVAIDAPAVDDAGLLLVPRARAKLTLRIAPGDDPVAAREALVAHLRTHAPWGAEVTVSAGRPGGAVLGGHDGPGLRRRRSAYSDAFGEPVVEIGVGGSIAFVAPFADAFPHAEILITGVEDPDTRAHGPNESLHLGDFASACLAEALLLERLGAGREPSRLPSRSPRGTAAASATRWASRGWSPGPRSRPGSARPCCRARPPAAQDSPMSSCAPSPEARITRRCRSAWRSSPSRPGRKSIGEAK